MTNQKKIVIATSNEHKLKEILEILAGIEFEIHSLKDFPGIGEIAETGNSFRENAFIKASTVFRHTNLLTLADDSGLEVDALNGAPGIYSARFSGRERDYAANNTKLLRELKNVPEEKRGAQFRCVVAIVEHGVKEFAEGIVRGRIITELRGERGFGYDPLFIPDGFNKTYAELGEEVKNQISHRAKAFRAAKAILQEILF
ncbi:MAG TPA: XTP/dITP diphosphatase [Caldithrix sp.]|nr:XTP/dITP diphosphatase [Caldithrix sp.]